MRIVVDEIPPSNNKFMGRGSARYQAFEYQNEKKRWAWLIKAAIGRDKPREPIEKAIVTITYYFPTKHRRDPDNYSGKFINDGLVKSGVIKDDSFSNIDLVLVGKVDRKNPRTVIKVKEVEG